MDILSIAVGVGVGLVIFLIIYLLFLKKTELISEDDLESLRNSERLLKEEKHDLEIQLSRIEERANQSAKWLEENKQELNTTERALIDARENLSAKEQMIKNLDEKLNNQKEELNNMNETMRKDFELLANKIFESKSEKFTKENKINLEQTLAPLKEKLSEFQNKVETTHKDNIEKSATLLQQIKNLKDLNEQMSSDAKHLTEALKGDSKTQGNWGELVLERILERSGLRKGDNYITQGSDMGLEGDDGKKYKPDVIIKLPEDKHIVIDSKVSLTSYERMVNAETEDERKKAAIDHVKSVRAHVIGLSGKKYHYLNELRSPDFTLMFLPIEASFSIAVQTDYELFNFAWDKKIVIVSPTTLFATLKTIASIWKQENYQRNADEIARQGGALYDKFSSFIADLNSIGKKIDDSKRSYDAALNKLVEGKGNLVGRAEKLRELGAKTTKVISPDLLDQANSDYSLEEN
ncbi:MAG: DNA recombination protein RmuC [Bacteroidia bacterium]|nr:DNA recombination protein RmuC [Bacteroidia bacterium]